MTLLKIGQDLLRSAIRNQRVSAFRGVVAVQTASAEVPAAVEVDEDLLPAPHISRVERINETTLCVSFSDNTQCNFNTIWVCCFTLSRLKCVFVFRNGFYSNGNVIKDAEIA